MHELLPFCIKAYQYMLSVSYEIVDDGRSMWEVLQQPVAEPWFRQYATLPSIIVYNPEQPIRLYRSNRKVNEKTLSKQHLPCYQP